MMSMMLTGLSLTCTVITLNIFHHSPETPVPNWLKKFAFQYLATIFCAKGSHDKSPDSVKPINEGMIQVAQVSEKPKKEREFVNTILESEKGISEESSELNLWVSMLLKKEAVTNVKDSNKAEWEKVAKIFDCLFLVLYIIIFIIFMGVIFGILDSKPLEAVHGYKKNALNIVD